jgi:hypothetical protein
VRRRPRWQVSALRCCSTQHQHTASTRQWAS